MRVARDRTADCVRVTSFLSESLGFRPRPDDVFVATYPRSGTTWMQFIVHLLLRDLQFDFDHVSRVTPWYERTLALGTRTAEDFEALPSPRVFKTHLVPRWLPAPCRVVYVVRDAEHVARSYFGLYRTHLGFKGDFESFLGRFLEGDVQYRSWFEHARAWEVPRSGQSVLPVRYEAMLEDLPREVDRVAAFLGVGLSAEGRVRLTEMASKSFMKRHEARFDPIIEDAIARGLSPGAFIGATSPDLRLNPGQRDALEAARIRFAGGPPPWSLPEFLH